MAVVGGEVPGVGDTMALRDGVLYGDFSDDDDPRSGDGISLLCDPHTRTQSDGRTRKRHLGNHHL